MSAWSDGYFTVLKDGTVAAKLPAADGASVSVPLPGVASAAMSRGLALPLTVRFPAILADRLRRLRGAFADAIAASGQQQQYIPVYPVKANQQRAVVETMLRADAGCGLEVGSKAEFMLAMALAGSNNVVICNGCKDHELLQVLLLARQAGLKIFIVVESIAELQYVLQLAAQMKVTPTLGLRLRLQSVAEGNWQSSGGYKSKFGLGPEALSHAITVLRNAEMLDSLQLLHFHIGSQIPDLKAFPRAITEACRYYSCLREMGVPLQYLDIGGGLAVDYDGTASTAYCSANYNMEQYAQAVVSGIQAACAAANVALPTIMTECGRALTAHHAMVITSVAAIEAIPPRTASATKQEHDDKELQKLARQVAAAPEDMSQAESLWQQAEKCWHDASDMFCEGKSDLPVLALAEKVYRSACGHLVTAMRQAGKAVPGELTHLSSLRLLCNFSVFQSLPDAWALNQVFPVMPLHGLDNDNKLQVTLHDLTCDSDGRLGIYVSDEGNCSTMSVPVLADGSLPLLGFFMVGAYQEVLGDVHNLFGNESSVTVIPDGDGYSLVGCVKGDTVAELLASVQSDPEQLLQQCSDKIDNAVAAGAGHTQLLRQLMYGSSYMQTPSFPGIVEGDCDRR